MKLVVLTDNNTYIDQYYIGEPALSFYLEDESSRILFDTGYSDVFMRNAVSLGVDLSVVDTLVFSHGHDDHTKGLTFLPPDFLSPNVRIIAHPGIFGERYENGRSIGAPFSVDVLKDRYDLTLTKEPYSVTNRLTFLGEIPDYFEFEKRKPIGVCKTGPYYQPDFVMDDSALVYHSGEGMVIITGCSHSGICNIIEYAKHICGDERILSVIGGFHLFHISDKLKQTIHYFRQNNIYKLYPCHCVSFRAKAEIHKYISIHEVGVGLTLTF